MTSSSLVVIFCCYVMVSAGPSRLTDEKGVQPRIINGADALHEDYPFLVSILVYVGMSEWSTTCGGSIVNTDTVLTACHCVTSDQKLEGHVKNLADPKSLRVVAGTAFWNESSQFRQVREVRRLVTHPQCKNFFQLDMVFANDVALMFLENPLNYTREVKPLPLPSTNIPEAIKFLDRLVKSATWCTTVGWGRTVESMGTQSKSLKSARVQLLTGKECRERFCKTTHNHCKENFEGLGQICVASPTSSDCYGDSGGPLVCNDVVVGTVSYGDRCWANLPTIFQGLRPILELFAINHVKIDDPRNVSSAILLERPTAFSPNLQKNQKKIRRT